ncbi:MAG: hypothetical protein CSA35_04655 [Dethiosulfovibrio peptidovorans]|nr:MAG: hypothetical protein CSA35_04655 [Dethiosulfovibrio peptidovorans]
MAPERVLNAVLRRWKKNELIHLLCSEFSKDVSTYKELLGSQEREDRIQSRKIWISMSDRYWQLFREIVVSMIKEAPDALTFSPEERLLLDCGFLSPSVTPFNEALTPWLNQPVPDDMFQYLSLSDFWAEKYGVLYNKDCRTGEDRFAPQLQVYRDRLHGTCRRVLITLRALLPQIPDCPKEKADDLISKLDKNLAPFLERYMRTRHFREMKKKEHDETVDRANAFSFAMKEIESLLRQAVRYVEGFGENERKRIRRILGEMVFIGTVAIHCRNELERWDRNRARNAAKYEAETDGERLVQIDEALKNKRELVGQMACIARLDTSPLCQNACQAPLSFAQISELLNRLVPLDEAMLRVPRVRMHGIPKVVVTPGCGYGTYDWTDNTLLLPLFPHHSVERTVTYALATFRWDADEDREFKNTYELLKENRGKSIKSLALSFSNDYSLWLTKERYGFRVLPREVREWFKTKFDSEGILS